ncbi:MAG: DivIVA domain-containing protein [Actinomycetota bacterium]|nr:DivIVA domain-containing protein [Actinomycetota bacterium]
MALAPDEIRKRQFDVGLRGYDRDQVERFRVEVADTIEALTRARVVIEERVGQLGIGDIADLGEEFRRVATEVGVILEDARKTATEMRRRADDDATRWRTAAETDAATWREEAQRDSARMRSEAEERAEAARVEGQRQAEELRGAAWDESTAMLERSGADAEGLIAEANQDALFIRAGAERDSLRLTGNARHEAEAQLKVARTEASRLVKEAERQSDRLIEEGRQVTDAAEERVRALEQRRVELLAEIESIQKSFDQMDIELEARLNPRPLVDDSEPAEWEIDPAVRVVPASRVMPPIPVDADELVAEVTRLRSGVIASAERAASPVDNTPGATDETEGLTDATELADVAEVDDPVAVDEEAGPGAITELEGDDQVAGASDGDHQAAVGDDAAAHRSDVGNAGQSDTLDIAVPSTAQLEPDLPPETATAARRPSLLDDLFARLRTGAAAGPSPAPPRSDKAEAVAETPPTVDAAGAAELRQRLLLPAENDAVRTCKRRLIDLQNQTLAAIHVDVGGWSVDPVVTKDVFEGAVATMVEAAYAAGHVAAGELTGRSAPKPPAGTVPLPTVDVGAEFAARLVDAYRRAIAIEAGERETAAAVTQVFRAWRTDEIERRMHPAAWTAYHHGLLSGFAMLAVERVTTIADGRRCADCAARVAEPWDPAGPSPVGWVLPPAHEGCVVTLVPA